MRGMAAAELEVGELRPGVGAARFGGGGRAAAQHPPPRLGNWAIPEAEIGGLGDVSGKVVLELGGVKRWMLTRGTPT